MKIAISNLAWDKADDEAVLALLKKHGVTGIEVAPTKIWSQPVIVPKAERAAYGNEWAARGIEVVALQSLLFRQPDLYLFDAKTRPALLSYLIGIIDTASDLGAGPMVFGSPKNRLRGERSMRDAISSAAEFFAQAAEEACGTDTMLCIEPNPPQYGADFIINTVEAVELAQAVNHPGFGINLDTGILTMNGEDYRTAIDMAFPYLRHVHISEPQLAPITRGTVDHEGIANHLREVGYDRWVSIEMLIKSPADVLSTIDNTLPLVKHIYGD